MGTYFNIDNKGSFRIGDIYGKYCFFDTGSPLVISFSHLGASVEENEIYQSPSPWAFDYLSKNKINCVCFSGIKGKNRFYRDKDFIDSLYEVSISLPQFSERLGYGTSMGAYAAAAFSRPLGINRLLLGSPISTRNININKWDINAGRSVESYNFDWTGPYNDAAESDSSGYVIYDPLYGLDAMHAKRFTKLMPLKLPGAGHSGFDLLNQAGAMDWLFKSFISNNVCEFKYYKMIKYRKKIPSYYFGILGAESTNITDSRAKKIINFLNEKEPEIYARIPDRFINGPHFRKNHGAEKKVIKHRRKPWVSSPNISPYKIYRKIKLWLNS